MLDRLRDAYLSDGKVQRALSERHLDIRRIAGKTADGGSRSSRPRGLRCYRCAEQSRLAHVGGFVLQVTTQTSHRKWGYRKGSVRRIVFDVERCRLK